MSKSLYLTSAYIIIWTLTRWLRKLEGGGDGGLVYCHWGVAITEAADNQAGRVVNNMNAVETIPSSKSGGEQENNTSENGGVEPEPG